MIFIELKENENVKKDIKSSQFFNQLGLILNELRNRDIPEKIIESIKIDIEEINSTLKTGNILQKVLKQKRFKIIKLLEKELKIVPKNYYRNLWFIVGMSVFGLPLGVAFGTSIGNMGLLGIGLPIGMVIGMAVGSRMDKKALEEGRQLNIEIKY